MIHFFFLGPLCFFFDWGIADGLPPSAPMFSCLYCPRKYFWIFSLPLSDASRFLSAHWRLKYYPPGRCRIGTKRRIIMIHRIPPPTVWVFSFGNTSCYQYRVASLMRFTLSCRFLFYSFCLYYVLFERWIASSLSIVEGCALQGLNLSSSKSWVLKMVRFLRNSGAYS